MNEKIKDYADKIAFSCFSEFVEDNVTCKLCNYKTFCEMLQLEEVEIQNFLLQKQKVYEWVDDANFKKNKYLARAKKAESLCDDLLEALKEEIETVCGICLKNPTSKCNTCEGICSRTKSMQDLIKRVEETK